MKRYWGSAEQVMDKFGKIIRAEFPEIDVFSMYKHVTGDKIQYSIQLSLGDMELCTILIEDEPNQIGLIDLTVPVVERVIQRMNNSTIELVPTLFTWLQGQLVKKAEAQTWANYQESHRRGGAAPYERHFVRPTTLP